MVRRLFEDRRFLEEVQYTVAYNKCIPLDLLLRLILLKILMSFVLALIENVFVWLACLQ